MTIVKFTQHSGYYHTDWDGDMSGEYVPLAEYQALKTHMESLAKETYQLKGLIRRVINMPLLDNYDSEYFRKLGQLLKDCQEALA